MKKKNKKGNRKEKEGKRKQKIKRKKEYNSEDSGY